MSDAILAVREAGQRAAKPPERLKPSQWAEKHLILSEKVSQFSGPFSYARTPYLVEIADNMSEPHVDLITFAKAAQVGGTQAVLSNTVGYAIDQDPGPGMIVFPSGVGGKEYSEERLQPMIDDCPRLAAHKPSDPDRYRKSTMYFDRMNLAIVGAGSPASLASRPVRYLWCDEIDKYKLNTSKEGNPLELADRRTRTFWNRKRFRISTPTTVDGPIWVSFLQGDRRRYWVPCPHCGEMQWLKFTQLKWDSECRSDGGSWDMAAVRASTYYECEQCQGKILDRHKPKMLRAGEWRPEIEGLSHRSYQLSALYPTWVSFGDVSTSFLESKPYPEKLQEFVTQTLGEPWEERGGTATVEEILQHRDDYTEGYCPGSPFALIITADVQKDSIYYVVRAWGAYETSWLIRYGQVLDFEALQSVVHSVYRTTNGKEINVTHGFIDSGFRTDEVYEFCRKYSWSPVKGRDSEVLANAYSWNNQKDVGLNLLVVKTDYYKDLLQQKLRMKNDDPGAWLLHRETDYGYAKQLVAEGTVEEKDKRGRLKRVWKRFDRDNHWLDCEVYQLAAVHACGIRQMREPDEDLQSVKTPQQVTRRDGRGYWDR